MADLVFLGTEGQTIAREMLVLYLNTGTTAQPTWSAMGKRVNDSSMSMDWGMESEKDILGNTFTTMKKPTITQSFDPMPLEVGSAVHEKLWNMAVYEQNAQALAALDVLIVHMYAGASSSATSFFAERYSTCAMNVTGLGGEGGGNITMPSEVTLGGTRTTGTAAVASGGVVTFTVDS